MFQFARVIWIVSGLDQFPIMDQLNRVLRWLGYTDIEAGVQVRWAVLNTAFILHHHNEARSKLAEAIALGKPVGFCIDAIENAISGEEC